jgi:hypothetical protein
MIWNERDDVRVGAREMPLQYLVRALRLNLFACSIPLFLYFLFWFKANSAGNWMREKLKSLRFVFRIMKPVNTHGGSSRPRYFLSLRFSFIFFTPSPPLINGNLSDCGSSRRACPSSGVGNLVRCFTHKPLWWTVAKLFAFVKLGTCYVFMHVSVLYENCN